jgi:hypothetical protein
VFTFDNATFTGEKRLYVDGNVEGIDRAITLALLNASGAIISEDRIFFSVEEYIDIRPIETLARLNTQVGAALAGDALQLLTAAEYNALKAAGLEVGRHDGLWDYVFVEIGKNYYTYIEPTLPEFSYQLFAIAPNTVSIASLQQLAGNANWLVGLGAADVALSIIPGGTSAGYLEQGDYAHAAAWFLADVALTLSVVGKLGQVTAKAGSVIKSGTAVRLGNFLQNAAKIGQYRHVALGATIATGILGAESGAGAVSDVLNGKYTAATIKGIDAVFAALGVASSGKQYREALTDAAKANKRLAEKVDVQQIASKTAHGSISPGDIAPDEWCFAPTTLVATASGRRPISEIEASEEVFAFDFDEGKYVLARVLRRHNNVFDGEFVTLTLSNGETLEVTANHPIWVVSGEELSARSIPHHFDVRADENKTLAGRWLNSQDLRPGDALHSRGAVEVKVTSICIRAVTSRPVCNLTVEGHHSFLVTEAELLAHNQSWCDDLVAKGWSSSQKEFLLDLAISKGLPKSAVHGHHIVMKAADDAASVAAREILTKYGIPILETQEKLRAASDLSNMAMAISHGHLGIHGDDYAKAVLDNLQAAVAGGGSKDDISQRIRAALGEMREVLERGKSFW